MLTVVTLFLGFLAGTLAVLLSQRLAARRADERLLERTWEEGWEAGHERGTATGYREGDFDGRETCIAGHAELETRAADAARAEVEAKWELRLPELLQEERARVRADILQEKAAEAVSSSKEDEDTYW